MVNDCIVACGGRTALTGKEKDESTKSNYLKRIDSMKNLLTLKQAAEILNVSESTVRRLVNDGELRSKQLGKNKSRKTVRIRQEWIDDYLDNDAFKSRPKSKSEKYLINRY